MPCQALPPIFPSISVFGYTKRSIVGAEIPVAGILGDQQAALISQARLERGEAKITWGTGAFLLVNSGEELLTPPEGILTTVAYTTKEGPHYAVEGSIFVAGAGVQWLRDNLGLLQNVQESEELALTLDHNEGVYFVPALTDLVRHTGILMLEGSSLALLVAQPKLIWFVQLWKPLPTRHTT